MVSVYHHVCPSIDIACRTHCEKQCDVIRMGRQISECSETSVTSTDTPSTEKRLQEHRQEEDRKEGERGRKKSGREFETFFIISLMIIYNISIY